MYPDSLSEHRLQNSVLGSIQYTEINLESLYFKAQQRLKEICLVLITKNCHKNHTNRIFLDQSTNFASYGMHVMIYFASLGIFMRQGSRMQRLQNHWSPTKNITVLFQYFSYYYITFQTSKSFVICQQKLCMQAIFSSNINRSSLWQV